MQALLLILFVIAIFAFKQFVFEQRRKKRRDYYRNDYLKSEVWKRKRYVVLKRDNWRCVYCGGRANLFRMKFIQIPVNAVNTYFYTLEFE